MAGWGFDGSAFCEYNMPGGRRCGAQWFSGWSGTLGFDAGVEGSGVVKGDFVIQ